MGSDNISGTEQQLQALAFDLALREWRTLLEPEAVVTEITTLQSYAAATFSTSNRIPAVLKPRTVAHVQECLRIATRHKVPVYPISSGKNWGYGSSVPTADNSVVMDLGAMRSILDFNENLGYVTIEPGVTQSQLYSYLKERNSKLWMDATGSSPLSSIIGNTLERGFGHTPYGDHFGHACNFEVVLPNGELLETGFPRNTGIAAAPVFKTGLGPDLGGLFAQSNLGVVTKMTVWLMPAPEYFEAFFFSCDSESGLAAVVDALRPLRLNGTLRSAIHIANDYKVLQGIQQYPWEETGGTVPLQPKTLRGIRRKLHFGAWNGSGGLYGTPAQVAEARRLVRLALKGKIRRIHFLNDKRLDLAGRYSRLFHLITGINFGRTLALVRPVYGLLQGIPTDSSLASVYWRKRTAPKVPMNLDADGCGLLWLSPVAPTEGKHAEKIAALAGPILLRHSFEPALSITLLTDRSLICVIAITYDRDVPGEDDRARACYEEVLLAMAQNGYLPYRLGIQSMNLAGANKSAASLVRTLKAHLDPSGILAPGRYQPPKA
ncbi:MAG: FAD-binding oxidoreductase [Bryobacteraceae bacterium]